MSVEDATRFIEEVYAKEELATEVLGDKDWQDADLEEVANYANEHGFAVSPSDLEAALELYTVDEDRNIKR